jgi:predicted lactoylglutathione lyase
MARSTNAKDKHTNNDQDISVIVQEISEAINAVIAQYKEENPDVDVDAILSEHHEMFPVLGVAQKRELDKFIAYAKEQGTKMPFDTMETGVLVAGHKDMQNGLSEILNYMKFGKPGSPERGEEMADQGQSKK